MNNERNKIYLAALLHDIGKFYQRADESINKKGNTLEEQSKQIQGYICPKNKNNYYTHLHTVWTNNFFEKNANSVFNKITEGDNQLFNVNIWSEENNDDNIANLAAYHHKPKTKLQKIIQIADWWSAGIDRKDKNEEDNLINHHTLMFKSFKEVPLFSVFNLLDINGEKDKNTNVAYYLTPLNIEKGTIFPTILKQEDVKLLQADYLKLKKQFEEEFVKLPTDSFSGFEESLLFLLKKYTWCIPSNTMDMANVSLFDHLKTTASIADSLYVYYLENKDAFNFSGDYGKVNTGIFPVMLLGVDISGIQSFIYDVASSKAARSLKGRSFYLQLLAESMLNKFKNHNNIQAKSANVLYASGGKMYLILPNTQKVKQGIDEIKQDIEQELWRLHKGKLSVNIDNVGFAYRNNFETKKSWIELEDYGQEQKELKELWKLLSDKLSKQKEQKFKVLLENNFDEFFDEKNSNLTVGGETKTCVVTGDEFLTKETIKYLDEDSPVKQTVFEQTELGNVLKDVDFLIMYKGNDDGHNYLSNKSKTNIKILDTSFYLFDDLEIIKDDADFRKITSSDTSSVIRVNNTDFLAAQIKGHKNAYGYQFYGGNKQAQKNDKTNKTFQDIAKTDAGENTLLGILRMDIDNLGKIFIKGFDEKDMSFSAFSTLSFHLDLFFSGYLNNLRDNYIEKDKNGNNIFDELKYPVYQFRDWLNILYSGGDDLFVVGRWDKTIEFAELVRNEFAAYSQRPEIGISGGITFVHEKFPIAKAADLAGEAENASKSYPKENNAEEKDKNAITFFGETISWDKEFETVKEYKEQFVKYIDDKNYGLSKGILHKLMLFADMKKQNENTKHKDYSYVWNTAYYLKRFAERFKFDKNSEKEKDIKNKEVYEFIMGNNNGKGGLQKDLFAPARNYDLVALAARWAEMELKYKK